MYYLYKNKYSKEINSMNTKDKKKNNYTNLRLTDDYKYYSEENEEKQQTSKNYNKLNEYIIKKEANMVKKIFENYFSSQIPSVMLESLYNLNDRENN